MKTSLIAVAAVAAAGALYFGGFKSAPHAPADLRDAVADSGSSAFGELKGAGNPGADVPVPISVEQVTGADGHSLAAPGSIYNGKRIVRQCFAVRISLEPSIFRGDTAAKTRVSVERALSTKGLKLLHYSDEYAVSHLEFSTAREEGMLGFTSNQGEMEKLLRALPEVKGLDEKGRTKQDLYWTVHLKEGLYPPRIKRVFSSLNVPHRIKHNDVRDELTIELEAASEDPASALYVLKTLSGIRMDDHTGLKRADMLVVTFFPDGSETKLLGWAGCVVENCKAFASSK